jgi:formylglycine-generating enzyme required for sulfatase activity
MMTAPYQAWASLLQPLTLVGVPPASTCWQDERTTLGGRVEVEVAGADLEAWLAETRTLAKLQHPAIPPLHEVGVLPDGRIARVRAPVTGARWVDGAPTLGERSRADALIRVAQALAHAHARGVAHGRFGEDALRLGESGQVWVVGWGTPADGGHPGAEGDVSALASLVDAWLGPSALEDLDERARLTTAARIAARLTHWLAGADRRGRALAWLATADARLAAGVAARRDHAAAMRAARRAAAARTSDLADRTGHSTCALETAVEDLRRAHTDQTEAGRRALHAALEQDPTLPEAHAAMARSWGEAAAEAQRAGAAAAEARAQLALREHVLRLPPAHPLRARDDRFLRGTGAVTLITDPPGALVTLERYEEVDHRLVLRPAGSLGQTPLHAVDLAPGSFRLRIDAPGHAPTLYPVQIGQNAHWNGVPPGESEALPIRLLPLDTLGADDRYVPAGWFAAGASQNDAGVWARPLWCDGFVIRRFPVTARELLTWLDALLDAGEEDRAFALAPRTKGRVDKGPPHHPRGVDGRFLSGLVPAQADWPALRISFTTAAAYANALRAADGRAWRLPMDFEWEKAARGVDGRAYPWGRRRAPRWANLSVPAGGSGPTSVDSFPLDESPYGVRGMAGNSADWVAEPPDDRVPELHDDRVWVVDPSPDGRGAAVASSRGGTYVTIGPQLDYRTERSVVQTWGHQGFRLARSV